MMVHVFMVVVPDPNAFNYNEEVTVDDGSCIEKVYGCTDYTYGSI